MALTRGFEITISVYQILSVILLLIVGAKCADFDVTKFDAKGDGTSDATAGVMKAWDEACKSTTAPKIIFPSGKFLTGELNFKGPCTAPGPITIEIQGTLLAKPDPKAFPSGTWVNIIAVDQVIINGGGTLHGQGEVAAWKSRALGEKGTPLTDSLVIANSKNSAISNIKLVNSKGFQMKVFDCTNFSADKMTIIAPGDSPNTDGIHIGRIQGVKITNSVIGVGDDCISIGDGSSDVTVQNVICGPGHGISVGSLGRYQDEKDVRGIHVSNCTLKKTTNGARIKTFRESPAIQAVNITFQDIIMEDVCNPIIIDQNYASDTKKGGSNVKISDIHFKNIKGSTTSNVAVQLNCSTSVPCVGIELVDIDFTYTGNPFNTTLASACANAKATFSGKMNPTACAI